jgi:pilus assembly protein TadC
MVFLLLVPLGSPPQLDALGSAILAAGLLLVIAGIRWMSRVMPEPEPASPIVEAVRDLAAQIRSGIPTGPALDSIAIRSRSEPLRRAAGSTRLGLSWEEALRSTGHPNAVALAAILASGRRRGAGTAAVLLDYAVEMSEVDRRRFERRLRRAPVLMVVPLVLCLLPGFALLTLGPFLRSIVA